MSQKNFPDFLPVMANYRQHFSKDFYVNFRGSENFYMFWKFFTIQLLISLVYFFSMEAIQAWALSLGSPVGGLLLLVIYLLFALIFLIPCASAISRRLHEHPFRKFLVAIWFVAAFATLTYQQLSFASQGGWGEAWIALGEKGIHNSLLQGALALYPIALIMCAGERKLALQNRSQARKEGTFAAATQESYEKTVAHSKNTSAKRRR